MNYNIWMFPHLWNKSPLPDDYNIPPTIYALLNSYVNYENPEPVKISNLAKEGRGMIFDFYYPLADRITKESFECMILNHFMMRRIGYETLTAFKLALNVKLNEIMPMYIKLFHAIDGWEIFQDGEITTREQLTSAKANNELTNTTDSNNLSDRRFSNTPQNAIEDVQSGTYISQYNYDRDEGHASSHSAGNSSDSGTLNETIKRSPADKMTNYIQFVKEKQNIYTMIFKDLDSLFYQII